MPDHFTIRDRVQHVLSKSGDKNAFYVVNLDLLQSQHRRWTAHLPSVRPFYAMKSNDDRAVLQALRRLGVGFDCASQREMQEVLALGVSPRNVIFANPVKLPQHLEYAAAVGVDLMTADSCAELSKIARHHPRPGW